MTKDLKSQVTTLGHEKVQNDFSRCLLSHHQVLREALFCSEPQYKQKFQNNCLKCVCGGRAYFGQLLVLGCLVVWLLMLLMLLLLLLLVCQVVVSAVALSCLVCHHCSGLF